MLTREENELLTRVGPGTPMGNLLRRYWHPIAPAAELDDHPTKEVRLLGEDLVLFRDRRGRYGLLARHCAHRRANLAYGIPEDEGLRCMYHGWRYDATGQCVEQPFEDTVRPDSQFKQKVKIDGYPVQSARGLLWAYLGPEPAPLLPEWEAFAWSDGYVDICISHLPCNWLQCQENSIDPVHTEWLHSYWASHQNFESGFGPPLRHLKVGFTPFDYGIIYRRVVEGSTEEDEDWATGRVCLFPNALFVGHTLSCHFEWRVPMDDENTMSVAWFINRVAPGYDPPKQEKIPYWYGPIYNEQGRFLTGYTLNQDIVAWVGQGRTMDRTKERLGESDRGIIMMRRLLQEQVEVVQRGGDPIGVFRDPERNKAVKLPLHRFGGTKALNPEAYLKFISFQAGEPPEVVEELQRVRDTWRDLEAQ
jgi:5,5'-dehydrodivanillate O-demethylase